MVASQKGLCQEVEVEKEEVEKVEKEEMEKVQREEEVESLGNSLKHPKRR